MSVKDKDYSGATFTTDFLEVYVCGECLMLKARKGAVVGKHWKGK